MNEILYTSLEIITVYFTHCFIGIMVRVFANGLGDRGSTPCRVIPKAQKMVLYAS